MTSVTLTNLPDAVYHTLRARAARHGRSTEAEIREILQDAAQPQGRIRLGSLLTSIARDAGGLTDAEVEHFNLLRDRTQAEPVSLE